MRYVTDPLRLVVLDAVELYWSQLTKNLLLRGPAVEADISGSSALLLRSRVCIGSRGNAGIK